MAVKTSQGTGNFLDLLKEAGVLVSHHYTWLRGNKPLTPEDLGLDPKVVRKGHIKLGHLKLLAPEVFGGEDVMADFKLIESRLNAIIQMSTFSFLDVARFAPNAVLPELLAKIEELEQQDRDARQTFLSHYADYREKSVEFCVENRPKGVSASEMRHAVTNAFPSAVDVERKFKFRVTYLQIAVPDNLDMGKVNPAEHLAIVEAREKAVTEATKSIRENAQSFIADMVGALRGEAVSMFEEMGKAIADDNWNQKTLNRVGKFLDRLTKLDVTGDEDLKKEVTKFRSKFIDNTTAKEYKEDADLAAGLRKGLRSHLKKLKALADADRQELVDKFGRLGGRKLDL